MMPPPKPPTPQAVNGATDAMMAHFNEIRASIEKSRPPTVNVSTAALAAVSAATIAALRAVHAPATPPPWAAPAGVRQWTKAPPPEVYDAAMLVILLVRQALPPQLAARLDVTPQDFATDAGLQKVVAALRFIATDPAVAQAVASGAGPAPAPPPAPPAGKSASPPMPTEHAEPDGDELLDAATRSA